MKNPRDLYFDCKLKPSELGGKGKVVGVFLYTEDFDDNLGKHNVAGLPSYFKQTVCSCMWEFRDRDVASVKADLIAAGFRFKSLRGGW